ncbi:hypothetical protein LUX33_41715 [Actinomadura madurae]|nr:hypothetical protein [Actinomadura madurae]MCP9954285.1 hypothetical protein [Actinomadura madurae]
MDDAEAVRGGQPEQRALEQRQRRLRRQRAPLGEHRLQRRPVHGLHDDRGAVRRLDQPEQLGDERVAEPG